LESISTQNDRCDATFASSLLKALRYALTQLATSISSRSSKPANTVVVSRTSSLLGTLALQLPERIKCLLLNFTIMTWQIHGRRRTSYILSSPLLPDSFSTSSWIDYLPPLPSISALFHTAQNLASTTIVTTRWEETLKPASSTEGHFGRVGSGSQDATSKAYGII